MSEATDVSPRSAVEADLRRVADRLAAAPAVKVEAATGEARAVLQLLADAAAGIDGRSSDQAPPRREVPALPLAALGDQVAVLGADLVTAYRGLGDAEPVWASTGREPLGDVLSGIAARLKALRLAL